MKYKKKEKYKTESEQLAAVKQDWAAIKFIKNPSEVVQLEAVIRHGCVIQYIENPTETIFYYLYLTDREAFDKYCEVIDND